MKLSEAPLPKTENTPLVMTFDEELRQAIEQSGGMPVELIDEKTNQRYYLMRIEQYEMYKDLIETGANPE